MSTLLALYPIEQYSLSWPHQGHRLWASMPLAFWVYLYKVERCPRSRAHDWKRCPYWHHGERARRRDPRTHCYLPQPCPYYLASSEYHKMHHTGRAPTCVHGHTCSYAHGIFEVWMHPDRFRTRMCDAGHECGRTICFFAHSDWQYRRPGNRVPFVNLRLLPSWALRAPPRSLPLPPRLVPPPVVTLPLIDEASTSSSSSAGSSSSTSAGASLSSSPPDVIVAAAATTTSSALGYPVNDAAASMSPAVGYPADDEMDNGMSDDEDSELGEFPYYDIIKDFVLG
ncbi:hypothetical protein EJB05_10642, partial [Eragrostis curvula]